jgi:hypothetical protein
LAALRASKNAVSSLAGPSSVALADEPASSWGSVDLKGDPGAGALILVLVGDGIILPLLGDGMILPLLVDLGDSGPLSPKIAAASIVKALASRRDIISRLSKLDALLSYSQLRKYHRKVFRKSKYIVSSRVCTRYLVSSKQLPIL